MSFQIFSKLFVFPAQSGNGNTSRIYRGSSVPTTGGNIRFSIHLHNFGCVCTQLRDGLGSSRLSVVFSKTSWILRAKDQRVVIRCAGAVRIGDKEVIQSILFDDKRRLHRTPTGSERRILPRGQSKPFEIPRKKIV